MSVTELKRVIGDNIRHWREVRGLSQEVLAQLVGYKRANSISRIETGEQDVPLSKLIAIADVLRVPVTRLFDQEQMPARNMDPYSEVTEALRQFENGHREVVLKLIDIISRYESLMKVKKGRSRKKHRC